MADLLPGEQKADGQDIRKVDRVRRVVADVYTFVRSQEINRTIGSFTFDHYIDEAKRLIKGEGRALRDASGQVDDIRPSKLELIETLEEEFNATLATAEDLAKKVDSDDSEDE